MCTAGKFIFKFSMVGKCLLGPDALAVSSQVAADYWLLSDADFSISDMWMDCILANQELAFLSFTFFLFFCVLLSLTLNLFATSIVTSNSIHKQLGLSGKIGCPFRKIQALLMQALREQRSHPTEPKIQLMLTLTPPKTPREKRESGRHNNQNLQPL